MGRNGGVRIWTAMKTRNRTDRRGLLAVLACVLVLGGLGSCARSTGPPDDPLYDKQESLAQIHIEAAWAAGLTGAGVTIGVIDTGCSEHADLDMGRISGRSYVDEDETDFSDSRGHGTFVVGLLAAVRDNGTGIAGMTDSDIRVYKVYGDSSHIGAVHVAQAVRDAVDDGCGVINLSMGTPTDHTELREAVAYAIERGVIVVAAAGGDSETLYYPAAYEGVIGVDALSGDLAPMDGAADNGSVDVTAPGETIVSLDRLAGYVRDGAGASYAAVHVTALAAFAKQAVPELGAAGFLELLKASVQELGEPGYDTLYGWGVIDCALLVEAIYGT